MNTIKASLMAAALLTAPAWAFAHGHGGRGHEEMMKSMDTNGDGMISKDEFMKAHETKWDELPKNKDGLVSLSDMKKMHHNGMKKRSGSMGSEETKK